MKNEISNDSEDYELNIFLVTYSCGYPSIRHLRRTIAFSSRQNTHANLMGIP